MRPVWFLLVVVVAVGPKPLLAQSVISREYSIKAAFLYNFGRYVRWPSEAFRDARAPFVIGVWGGSMISSDLRRIAQTKKIQGRPIQVRQFSSADEVENCHILFFSADVEPQLVVKVVRRFSGEPALLVGEREGFLGQGGMISLIIKENKVQMYIALKAAQREQLAMSSKLLQVAKVVN